MPKKKRKVELVHYKQLKKAAGGRGSMGGGHFYAGQDVICKIVRKEPGGYTVIIPAHNLLAFLPTQALLRAGEEPDEDDARELFQNPPICFDCWQKLDFSSNQNALMPFMSTITPKT